jgi:hypothetical protein
MVAQVKPETRSNSMAEELKLGKALAAKILVVQKAVSNIPKRGKNEFHHYDYVMAADAVEAIGKACNEAGLVVLPLKCYPPEPVALNPGQDTKQRVVNVTIDYLVADPSSGEQIVVPWTGQGADALDKGPYKAMTGNLKYFLMQFFMVAGGYLDAELPDDREAPKGQQRGGQQRQPQGQPQQTAPDAAPASKGIASASKIKYISDLMQSEWIPGKVRTSVANWLETHKAKKDWPDDGASKIIDQLKKFWPIPAKDTTSVVTDKQVAFIESLVKSSDIPKGLATKVTESIANHRNKADWKMSREHASAMIEACQWCITEADRAKKAAAKTPPEAKSEQEQAAEYDRIQDLLAQIDKEWPLHSFPGGEIQMASLQAWRDSGSWTVAQCEAWLSDIKGWPPAKAGK